MTRLWTKSDARKRVRRALPRVEGLESRKLPATTYLGVLQNVGKLDPGRPDAKHNSVPSQALDPFGWFINGPADSQNVIERLTPKGLAGVHVSAANRTFAQVVTAPDASGGFIETTSSSNSSGIGQSVQFWVGRATLAGNFTEIALSANSVHYAGSMVAGPDSSLWFVDTVPGVGTVDTVSIGRLDPSGVLHNYPLPEGHVTGNLTIGPDGNVWFTESVGARVSSQLNLPLPWVNGAPQTRPGPTGYFLAHMTSSGELVETPISGLAEQSDNGLNGFYHIEALADGNFWYATQASNTVTRLSLDGTSTTFAMPASTFPDKVVLAPDGNYWIEGAKSVTKLTPGGLITQYPVALGRFETLADMFVGPDRNLWFKRGSAAERITLNGVPSVVVIVRKTGDGGMQKIMRGPDGGIWIQARKNGAFGPLKLKSLRKIPATIR